MFLWFIGTAPATVWLVFRDPRFDYRLLAVGALLPDVIDLPARQARWAHSLTVAVGVLVVVMVVTAGRKPVRRLLLALPIGMLLHLVFDGAFSATQVFWWPFAGGWGEQRLFSLERGWWNVPLEIAGAAILWRAWRTFGLAEAERRRELWRRGTLRPVADARH
jgi:hypothetical protein